jgi:hypothetical protein
MPQRQQYDPGAERDPLGHRGEGRERDDDVQDRVAVRDVIAGPDRVVAELLRRLRELAVAAGIWHPVHLLPAPLDTEGDRHRPTVVRPAVRQAFS